MFQKLAQLSIRRSIFAIILSIAALSLVALIASAQIYERFIFDIEKQSISERVNIKLVDFGEELKKYGTDLGITLQSEEKLQRAVQLNDLPAVARAMDDHFHQYYVTAGVIDLVKIYFLDSEYEYQAQSNDGRRGVSLGQPVCPDLAARAKTRLGIERLKPLADYCVYQGRAYFSVITPVGTLSPKGYLQTVLDPTYNAPEFAANLDLPVKMYSPSGDLMYVSKDWPHEVFADNYVFVTDLLRDASGNDVSVVETAGDITEFKNVLVKTTYGVAGVALVLFGIGLALAAFISRSSLNALGSLARAATRVSGGQYESIAKSGYAELDNVIEAFNLMVERVRNSQTNLENEVASATDQLRTALSKVEERNQELESAIKMAEQGNVVKSAFLTNMSHELRTPLNAVIGYSEMVLEDLKESGQAVIAGDVERIRNSGKHLLAIVNDILDLSKVEAGEMELNLDEFDAKEVVTLTCETAKPKVVKNNNELKLQLPDNPVLITSDGPRVKQILLNLLNNAAKFTVNGVITVVLEEGVYLGNSVVHIKVQDTGEGIPPEKLNDIFQPFQQADISTTRKYEGTGLGLTLCRQLCNALGGAVSVESELGKGSVFTIRLPKRVH